VPGHDVRIDVDRIDRILNGDAVIRAEDVEDVAGVALGAVGDEDFVGRNVHTVGTVVVLGDGLAEEVVPLLRAVAAERLALRHLIDGRVHGRDAGGRQRLGDVADAEPDHLGLRVRVGVGLHAARDLGEQVAGLELEVMVVDAGHRAVFDF
jgi:hypothetical protein